MFYCIETIVCSIAAENIGLLFISDVRYAIFSLFPITIIAHVFYHDTIIITIYIPSLSTCPLSKQYIDIGDTCSTKVLNYNTT